MENQSPAIPKWSALLIEAVTKPGLIMKAYSAFHAFSIGNQLLALVQCQMRYMELAVWTRWPKRMTGQVAIVDGLSQNAIAITFRNERG